MKVKVCNFGPSLTVRATRPKRSPMKPGLIALILVATLLALALLAGLWGSRRRPLGVQEGRLLPCPDSPNCVSSFSEDEHAVAGIPYTGTPQEAIETAVQVLAELPRTTLLTKEDTYARFAVRSARLGFTDDVEFLAVGNTLHFRSASRLGYDDLGVNRERMTLVSRKLRERLANSA